MTNLRELAEKDLAQTMEQTGTPYVLIAPDNTEYSVKGQVGDISLLIVPESGEQVRSRSIVCSCRISTLAALTSSIPRRGWRARLTDLQGNVINTFVAGCNPDRTLGIYNLKIALDLESVSEEVEVADAA